MPLNPPDRASFEFLKTLAKERLSTLRATNPAARLADAQLAVARDYGFPSWRALKKELDHRRAPHVAGFISACTAGDVDVWKRSWRRTRWRPVPTCTAQARCIKAA